MKTIVVSVLSLAIGFSIGLNVHYIGHHSTKSSNDSSNQKITPNNNGHLINLDNIKGFELTDESTMILNGEYRIGFRIVNESTTLLSVIPITQKINSLWELHNRTGVIDFDDDTHVIVLKSK